MAKSVGKVTAVSDHMAQRAHDFMLGKPFFGATFNYFARRVLERFPDCISHDRHPISLQPLESPSFDFWPHAASFSSAIFVANSQGVRLSRDECGLFRL